MIVKKLFTTCLVIGLCVGVQTVLAESKQFPDVQVTHPHFVAISYLSEKGVVAGNPDGSFAPDRIVNRAEALKIILAGLNFKTEDKLVKDSLFSDVKGDEWFAIFIANAKEKGIINGNPDGSFTPAREVVRAEFMKMLLMTAGFKQETWAEQELFDDVPKDAWFNAYMNYAGKAGLISKDEANNLYPSKPLSRSEVAEILYLMTIILNGKDTQFLIDQSEAQMAQIELYIAGSDINNAKRASELAVDLTQQAYRNLPDNNVVLGAAKIARGYDSLVDAFVYALQKDFDKSAEMANLAIQKADEAWQANNETQPIARHLKDRAREILAQIERNS